MIAWKNSLRVALLYCLVSQGALAQSAVVQTADTPRAPARVAVIGGGASGLATAWLLEEGYQVTLLEKEARLGGHVDTIELKDGTVVEAGFEFFNQKLYPHFFRLLELLSVKTTEFPLHYTYYHRDGSDALRLPPSTGAIMGNVWRLLKFNRFLSAAAKLVQKGDSTQTLEEFIATVDLDQKFQSEFLYPFLASMWGVSPREIRVFAAIPVVSWLALNNTGTTEPPRFHEVKDGASAYIKAIASQLSRTDIQLNKDVQEVAALPGGRYRIRAAGGYEQEFDHVVFATNAYVAGKLARELVSAADVVRELGRIKYFKAYIAIHGDKGVMPEDKSDWSEVNVGYNGKHSAITVYKKWRNRGDSLVFKSWVTYEVENKLQLPNPLYALREYYHARIDPEYIKAQAGIRALQGKGNLWFAGIYTNGRLDSHESAIDSAIHIARRMMPEGKRLKALVP